MATLNEIKSHAALAIKAAMAGAAKSKEAALLLATAYRNGEELPASWAVEFKRDAALLAAYALIKPKIQAHLALDDEETKTRERYALCVLVAQWRSQYATLRANGIALTAPSDTIVAAFRRASMSGLLLRNSEGKLKEVVAADKAASAPDKGQALAEGSASADVMARVLRAQQGVQAAHAAFVELKGANKARALVALGEALQSALRELADIAN